MKRAIRRDRIMKLFLHNVMSSGLKEYIFPIRGSSDEIANILKTQTFDFIYIDGDHSYSQFKKDLINYSKFCKKNGILCGDDLDVFPDEIDLENAERHKEEDFIKDSKSNKSFHPGIVLAIKEFFGDVNMLNGFWFIRKSKNGWKRMII